jgi:hypothetical protein
MAKITIRNAEGEFMANYDHLSEANTFLEASFPGNKMQQPKGGKAQTLEVKDDEGKACAYVDLPATKAEGDGK